MRMNYNRLALRLMSWGWHATAYSSERVWWQHKATGRSGTTPFNNRHFYSTAQWAQIKKELSLTSEEIHGERPRETPQPDHDPAQGSS